MGHPLMPDDPHRRRPLGSLYTFKLFGARVLIFVVRLETV